MASANTQVDLYVDPCCPFAWIAYRWLTQVRRHRTVELRTHLMSLAILNKDQGISSYYQQLLEHTWAPARVAAAVQSKHGDAGLTALYPALARRIFVTGDDHYRIILNGLPGVIAEALAEAKLPAELAQAAQATGYDEIVKASHDTGMAAVGKGGGTPIIHMCGNAFFGPVMTAVPGDADAVRVFDGLRLLASFPNLFEVRRPLAGHLDFDVHHSEGSNGS